MLLIALKDIFRLTINCVYGKTIKNLQKKKNQCKTSQQWKILFKTCQQTKFCFWKNPRPKFCF